MKNNLLKTEKMMTVVENTAVEAATKFSNYGSEKHKFRNKFVALFVCMFLFGTANIFAQQIWTQAQWDAFVLDVVTTGAQGSVYTLMVDVGTPGSPIAIITTPIDGTFQGTLNGNNNRIMVNINDNNEYVGLFRNVANNALISNLVVDGQITGGPNSKAIGGFAGQVLGVQSGITITNFSNCMNLSSLTGTGTQSIGGIAGIIEDATVGQVNYIRFVQCINNGFLEKGVDIGGIIGSVTVDNAWIYSYSDKNSGTLTNATHSIGGIIGSATGNSMVIRHAVNIGKIQNTKPQPQYIGGIVGHSLVNGMNVMGSINSGILAGAIDAIGGIVGYVGNVSSSFYENINTNWVENIIPNSGAIIGFNATTQVWNCFYDRQMCSPALQGIGNGVPVLGPVDGLLTVEMLGNNLVVNQGFVPTNWTTVANLYPRPINVMPTATDFHPISLLAAAPIYLQNNPVTGMPETLNEVTQNFFVSNFNNNNPLSPFPIPPPYFYRWGSFDDSVFPWNLIPRSVMGYIDVLPFGIAMINGSGSGWDTLSVRIDYWNLIPVPYPMSYEIIFEKVVPINLP